MPISAQRSISGSEDRNAGENRFCTDTSRPPSTSWAVRIWSGSAFDTPTMGAGRVR